MIAIKRRCKFFDRCKFADDKSRVCTKADGYCVTYRTLSRHVSDAIAATEAKRNEERVKKMGKTKNKPKNRIDEKPFTPENILLLCFDRVFLAELHLRCVNSVKN